MAKKAIARPRSTTVANIQEELRKEAAAMDGRVGSGETNRIKITDKVFTLPDGSVVDDTMSCVILDFTSKNTLYRNVLEGRKYDPKNPEPPVCFAIGDIVDAMRPSPNAPEPQAESCKECPMNQWGSDGDAKACKNTRMVAVTTPDADAEAPLMTLEVSPTALKSFDGFVNTVRANFQMPPIAVVADVNFHPERSYPQLMFSIGGPNENLAEHYPRRAEARQLINQEPDLSKAGAEGSGASKRGAAGRNAPARRRATTK